MTIASSASGSTLPEFDLAFRGALRDLFTWRRDVRRFRRTPLPAGALDRLLELACLAPSVGLSEPWRFVIVEDALRREAVRACFEACNAQALRAQEADRAGLYARLKLAGFDDAPCQVAVFADRTTLRGHGLGRLTMPEMIEYSAVIAVHTLWLAARAEGIGVGWVSILDPARIAAILDTPPGWKLIGYLCLGYPAEECDTPLLERQGWEQRRRSSSVILRR
ncbi:MAG: 5,6-dimethylbenzimidazole synthase [Hyphomicrobiales bacterium]